MLYVQLYLRQGHSLEELHSTYDIDCIFSEDKNLVALNYRLLAPMDEQIPRECRGLFLEFGTWNIVCKSLDAFFDYDSKYGNDLLQRFDWPSAVAIDKLDGHLVCLYYHNNQWCVGTRVSPDGSAIAGSISVEPEGISYRDLVKRTVKEMGYDWDEYTNKLNPNLYYSFELTGPDVRVGVVYNEHRLTLIGAINCTNLTEVDIYSLDWPWPKAKRLKVNSIQEAIGLNTTYSEPHKHEGWILLDRNFNRLKVKNPLFLQMMNAVNVQSERQALNEIKFISVASATYASPYEIYDMYLDKPVTAQSVLTRILLLAKEVTDEYAQYKNTPATMQQQESISVWPNAFKALCSGLSMSDYLDKASEDELLEVLEQQRLRLSKTH